MGTGINLEEVRDFLLTSGTRPSRKLSFAVILIALALPLGSQPLQHAGDAARTALELPPYSEKGISNINTPAMTPDVDIVLVGIHESDPQDGLAWAIRPDLLHRTWTRVWTYGDIAVASETSPALSSGGERVYQRSVHGGWDHLRAYMLGVSSGFPRW